MSADSNREGDLGGADWVPRPIVLPTFRLPSRLADHLSWGLLTAATAAVVAGLVTAVSFQSPVTSVLGGLSIASPLGSSALFPQATFADRVSLFVSGGASLTVALLLLTAAVVAAMAVPANGDVTGSPRRWLLLLSALSVMASIVVLANVVLAIEILTSTSGGLVPSNSPDRLTAILNLLPATLTAAAALAYAAVRLTTSHRHVEDPEP